MAANRNAKTKPLTAGLPDARNGLPERVRGVKLPVAHGKAKAVRATVAERQATAACFQPLPPESTFAAFLLSRMEPGRGLPEPDGTVLQKYTGLLLTIAQEQFAYCGQADSAQQIRTGHFFLESIALLFGRELLFGKRTLASDAQRMYDAVLQICQNEKWQEEVNKESALTVLYDCLLLASNSFTMAARENTVTLHTLQIDVPCIFAEIEKRLCPKGRLAEQYRQVRNLSRGKTKIPKQAMQVITAYHAFAYMRLASGLVSGSLKEWRLL